eukprot:391578-Prymnesium_polylepis.1
MSRASKAACHPVLTPQLQDSLRKTMLSGHGYGKRRSQAQHDTLEGALHQCARVRCGTPLSGRGTPSAENRVRSIPRRSHTRF